jgi:hypothetical protein
LSPDLLAPVLPIPTNVSENPHQNQLAVESRWQTMLRVFTSGKSASHGPDNYITFNAIAPIFLGAAHTMPAWIIDAIRGDIPSENIKLSVGQRICLQDMSRVAVLLNPKCPTIFCTLDRIAWAEPGYHVYEGYIHLYSCDGKFPENSAHHLVAVPDAYICDLEHHSWGRDRSLGQRISLMEMVVLPPLRKWETDPAPIVEVQELDRRKIEFPVQEIEAWVKLGTN